MLNTISKSDKMRLIFLDRRRLQGEITPSLANTFIGGVSSTIPTKAALALKLGISESNISYFVVVGNDIEAKIDVDYTLPNNSFKGNSDITYYKEKIEGKCIDIAREFEYTSNLIEVEFLRDIFIDQSAFISSGLKRGIFHNATTMYYFQSFLSTNTQLLYFPKLKFREGNGTLPSAVAFGNAKNVFIPLAEQIGNTQGNENHFLDCHTGIKIWANTALQTSNAGAEEGDLAYARTNKNAVIDYTQVEPDFFTKPQPLSNLSIGNTYATTIQLVDSGANSSAIKLYKEIKINGVIYPYVVPVNGFISGLTPSTSYDIEAVAVDIYYNQSAKATITKITAATESTYIPNIEHYFRMEDSVINSMGNKLNLTYSIDSYEDSIAGRGGKFNGLNSYIDLGATTVLGGKTEYTFMILFKNSGKGSSNPLLASWLRIGLRINSGQIQFYSGNSGGTWVGGNMFAFSDTTSYHVFTGKYDGSKISGYLDKVVSPTAYNLTGAIRSDNVNGNLRIGADRSNRGHVIIDEVIFFDRALNDAEREEAETKLLAGQPII